MGFTVVTYKRPFYLFTENAATRLNFLFAFAAISSIPTRPTMQPPSRKPPPCPSKAPARNAGLEAASKGPRTISTATSDDPMCPCAIVCTGNMNSGPETEEKKSATPVLDSTVAEGLKALTKEKIAEHYSTGQNRRGQQPASPVRARRFVINRLPHKIRIIPYQGAKQPEETAVPEPQGRVQRTSSRMNIVRAPAEPDKIPGAEKSLPRFPHTHRHNRTFADTASSKRSSNLSISTTATGEPFAAEKQVQTVKNGGEDEIARMMREKMSRSVLDSGRCVAAATEAEVSPPPAAKRYKRHARRQPSQKRPEPAAEGFDYNW